ncbi:MAG: riboflavin synthase [Rhodothermaceae bacterium]
MFTGLVEEIGKIVKIELLPGGKKVRVLASEILDDLKIDDSIAINGVCLTATKLESDGFWADAVGETLDKTSLAFLKEGSEVNVERALRLSDRLGGHIVQGHVNGIAEIVAITKRGDNYLLEINVPKKIEKYTIEEGSITIDGISLTIAQLTGTRVGISVIPHTWNNTTLRNKKVGDKVNIETDVIAKYIEKLMNNKTDNGEETITEDWLKRMGF